MKKTGILILCALLAFSLAKPAGSETEARSLATIGSFTLTEGMVKLYCLQDEAAKTILVLYGLSSSVFDKTPICASLAESWLMTACAAAQAALDAGILVSSDSVEEIITQELVNYPLTKGQEYLAGYARFVADRFEGSMEELISTAVSLRRVQILAEQYLSQTMKSRLKDKTDKETARVLSEELSAHPCERMDGAVCELSLEWLLDQILLLRN